MQTVNYNNIQMRKIFMLLPWEWTFLSVFKILLLGKALMGNRVLPQTISKQTTVKLFDHFNFDKIEDVYTEKTKAPWKKTYPRIIQVDVTCVALSLESKLRELFSPTCKYQPHTRRRVSNCKERRWTRVPQRQQKRLKQGETEWWWWQCWW